MAALPSRARPVGKLVPAQPGRERKPRPPSRTSPPRGHRPAAPGPARATASATADGQVVAIDPRPPPLEIQRVGRHVVGLPAPARPSRLVRHESTVCPGTSYSRSRLTLSKPASRAAATVAWMSAGVCRRPRRFSSAASKLCAPIETRLTPAARKPARSPRSAGPGLTSIVISASAAMPNARSAASSSRATCAARHQRRRAAAEVDAARGRRRLTPRSAISATTASTNASIRFAGPRAVAAGVDDEVAVRADATGRTGSGRTARPARRSDPTQQATASRAAAAEGRLRRESVGAALTSGSRAGSAPGRATTSQPAGVSVCASSRSSSSSSSTAPLTWPAWPVATKIAKRVIAWPRNAAPMPPVIDDQPAAGEADPQRQQEHPQRPALAGRVAWPGRTARPGRRSRTRPASSTRAAGRAGCRGTWPRR